MIIGAAIFIGITAYALFSVTLIHLTRNPKVRVSSICAINNAVELAVWILAAYGLLR